VSQSQSSYRQIMKATSVFGGVQVINIIIQIVRSKLIAVLLGAEGMGINGLFTTTISLIQTISGLGIRTSSVKNIAAANAIDDKQKVAKVLSILRKLVWITGMIGAIFTLLFAKQLSQMTFGSEQYEIGFRWLSISFLFNQLNAGQLAALQGLRKIKMLASANLIGAILGLFISIPLYYFYHIDGIVPAIILTSISGMLISWFYARKIKVQKVSVDRAMFQTESKEIISMGIMLSLSGFFVVLSSYVLRIFIGNFGSLADVGLYSAGFGIVEGYVGVIFSAMSADYYPRLAGVHDKIEKLKETVTQQAEIAILILSPIITAFLILSPIVVVILYSKEFLPITTMISIAILGMYFRASSWAMGFILYAKSDSKLFLKTAIFFNITFLISNIAGYYLYGLTGLGISFFVNYIIHFLGLKFITARRYKFSFTDGFAKLFITGFSFCICAFLVSTIEISWIKYTLGFVIFTISFLFTLREMNKKVDIKSLLKKMRK